MNGIVLLAILALAIVGGYAIRARWRGAVSELESFKPMEFPKTEPAEEGARVTEEASPFAGEEPRKAA